MDSMVMAPLSLFNGDHLIVEENQASFQILLDLPMVFNTAAALTQLWTLAGID